MKVTDLLEQAQEDLLRLDTWRPHPDSALLGLNGLICAITDALPGQPGAASYDTPVVGGHTTVLDERGIPVPAVSDPTGETASELADHGHPAVSDLKSIKRHVAAIASHADALIRISVTWQSRPPTKAEQRETARQNLPGCDLHSGAGLFSEREPGAGLITAAGGFLLPKPMHLCAACRQRIGRTQRVPSKQDLQHHHDHGKWPNMLEQNYRGSAA